MRHINKYILTGLLSFTAIGCVNEEFVPEFKEAEVPMTFIATIEKGELTKTTLGESDEFGHRKLLWNPADSIAIATGDWYSSINKFVNTNTETSEKGVFEGSASDTETYYAMYPYSSENDPMMNPALYYSNNTFYFSLPSVQKYAEGTFASDVNFMVAKAEKGEDLQFKNLCGILVIKITGEETIKSISISAKDETGNQAKLSGPHSVTMDYVEAPVLTPRENASAMITIDCGDGVAINSAEPTPFYVVLPPGTYTDLMVTIGTADGKMMLKEGKNHLNINRAEYITAGTLAFEAEIAIDLSSKGTSNCYIVSEPGVYSFDAGTIGNGEFGIIETGGVLPYHTTDASINPSSAEILWCTNGCVTGATFSSKDKRVSFVANGEEGNALIAVKDSEGKILWSWHIWATDTPQDQLYVNTAGSYTVMDRNLGAIRADAGSSDAEIRESIGNMYQWGRKDPFHAVRAENESNWTKYFNTVNTRITIAESIEMPTTITSGNSDWEKNSTSMLWNSTQKTIYDPCPVGYRVPVSEIWTGFTTTGEYVDRASEINYSGTYEKGFYFLYDGVNTTWYPATVYKEYWEDLHYNEDRCRLWSAANNDDGFEFYYSTDMECFVSRFTRYDNGYAHQVRCMKDEATASLIVKMNDMEDVGATRATAVGKVATYGEMTVLKSGFVVGSASDVNIYSGTVYETTNTTGQISAEIIGLEALNRYYIRAFATTSESTVYSEAVSFFTPNSEGVIDLSVTESANSYLVKPVYSTYSFKMVKGNSNVSVGAAATAEVLWETYNTSDAVTQNSVIASVSIDGDKVKFTMPEDAVPGNAVIAVKDSEGTILWSWHIWVSDFDPETTKQTYLSGAVMMDRNLGALNIADNDSRSYGLLYQWGRKDPFTAPVSDWNFASTYPSDIRSHAEKITDYNYSIQNPTVSLPGTDWNSDNTLWSSSKTIYDPCPAGWRVPDGGPGVWANIDSHTWNGWHNLASIETKGSPAYYPTGGYADGYGQNIHDYGNWSRLYSCTPRQESDVCTFAIGDGWSNGESTSRDFHLSVRCMKDEPPFDNDSNEGYGESDDYEW